jgi:hypothetical protein
VVVQIVRKPKNNNNNIIIMLLCYYVIIIIINFDLVVHDTCGSIDKLKIKKIKATGWS